MILLDITHKTDIRNKMKKCTKCGEEKPATLEYFYAHSRGSLRSECKKCHYKKHKAWAKNNREKMRSYNDKWKQKNPDYVKNYKINPETRRNKERRRRARIKGNGFEKYTESELLSLYGTNCYLCGNPIDLTNDRRCGFPGWETSLWPDHIIPIAKGGPDTLSNVRPAHGSCNHKKNDRILR